MSFKEWKSVRLGEVAGVQTGPFGSQLHKKDYVPIGTPIITVEHLGENHLIHENLPRVTEEDKERLQKYSLKEGDIVFSRVGSVDRRALIKKDEEGWLFSGRCLRVRPKSIELDSKYLSYFFGLNSFKEYIRAIAVGSTMPSLNTTILSNIEITLPPINIQHRIADILSSLDEKIALNRQTNATLEAIAQVIFKEWFVDFNFPGAMGEMIESELGMIPKGWEVGKLSDVVNVIDCLHSKKPERVIEKTGFILLQLWNILDTGLLDLSDPFWISEKDYNVWISRIEANEGVIVITNVGRVGAAARIPKGIKAALGRNMTALKTKDGFLYDIFLILLLKSDIMRNEIELKTDAGTILDSLNVRNIPLLRFAQPPSELTMRFESIVKPIWEKMETNLVEIHTLAEIRDTLLPKLMRGESNIDTP